MMQEQIISMSGGVIITTGGRRVAIGNADHRVGDWVWVDSGCVFGHMAPVQSVPYVGGGDSVFIEATWDGTYDIYRIRSASNPTKIIAEYQMPDDFYLDNNWDTYIVYNKNKFCIMGFLDGLVIIRILQNGVWSRNDITLPYSSKIHARDAYFDDNDDLHWVVYQQQYDLTVFAFCEYLNSELISNINYTATINSLASNQENVVNNFINDDLIGMNITELPVITGQTSGTSYLRYESEIKRYEEGEWNDGVKITDGYDLSNYNNAKTSINVTNISLWDKVLKVTVGASAVILVCEWQRETVGNVVGDWFIADYSYKIIGSISRLCAFTVSSNDAVMDNEMQSKVEDGSLENFFYLQEVFPVSGETDLVDVFRYSRDIDFTFNFNVFGESLDQQHSVTVRNDYIFTFNDGVIILSNSDWLMNVTELMDGYIYDNPPYLAEHKGKIIFYSTSTYKLYLINKSDKTYIEIHSDFLQNLQIPIIKMSKAKLKSFLGV